MVLTMHYCGVAVLEAYGDARGPARSRGRRSPEHARVQRSRIPQPLLGAGQYGRVAQRQRRAECGEKLGHLRIARHRIRLVVAAARWPKGSSTLWLVPATAHGSRRSRGRSRVWACAATIRRLSPRTASPCHASAMLGADGQGFDIMMGVVLPVFAS